MSAAPKVLVFAGSTRKDSFNKKLARVGAEALRAAGAEVTELDLREYPLPLYDGDLEAEQGVPENAHKLRELFQAHDALLISAPEYNSSITAVLKNTIDWISRPVPDVPPLAGLTGKVVGLLSASPGALGGLRGLVVVRMLLGNLGMLVIPDQVALPRAHEAFDAEGKLVDPSRQGAVEKLAEHLVRVTASLRK